MSKLLADAKRGGYAVCYCEAWSLESFQAVVEAAEEERSPIIAGFNGGFLMHPGRKRAENLAIYASLGLSLAKARVPAALLFNESASLAQIEEAIDLGFNAVMVENEGFELDDYRRLVRQVVAKAHRSGVSVEAQVGHLANASSNGQRGTHHPGGGAGFCGGNRNRRFGRGGGQCPHPDNREGSARSSGTGRDRKGRACALGPARRHRDSS